MSTVLRLPNIRRMFVPDPGFIICDADLAGADAQVVAWEAGDEDLKQAFRSGIKIHVHNARAMWPHETKDMDNEDIKKSKFYKPVKIGCHAANYGATAMALVFNNGWTRSFSEEFIERWFFLHPKIKQWHKRTNDCLTGMVCWNCSTYNTNLTSKCGQCGVPVGRTIKNQFGFRRIFFERLEDNLLPTALAWTPQSTVAFCTEIGWTALSEGPSFTHMNGYGVAVTHDWSAYLVNAALAEYYRQQEFVQFLIQVHDSIVFQVRNQYKSHLPDIVKSMQVRVPYPDPLIIGMDYKASEQSWGDC